MNKLTGKISVDFRSTEPLYLQIARQIEQLVAQGDLTLGDQLPTVRELATELRINFNTVSRAYKMLDDERIISTQRGRGTYIWEEPQMDQLHSLRQQSFKELCRRCIADAIHMGFPPDEILQVFTQELQDWKNEENPSLIINTER